MGRIFDAVTFGPARRRRSMNKQPARLDAAYRLGTPASAGDWQPYEPSASASLGRPLLVLALVLVVVSVGGVVVLLRGGQDGSDAPRAVPTPERSASSSAGPGAGSDSSLPPAGVELAPNRLRPVVTGPAGSGGYAFASNAPDGSPVTYDPCRPIHYVVRPDDAPANGVQLIQQAVARVSEATGLVFTYDGVTTEAPGERKPYQPGRYGERWAPVLITWSDPQEVAALAGSTTGTGGSQAVTVTSNATGASETAYVTGSVVLDTPQLRRFAQSGGQSAVRAVIAHELGHVVGLAHVEDSGQLMYRESRPSVTDFQNGDLRGLARLGAGACHPTI